MPSLTPNLTHAATNSHVAKSSLNNNYSNYQYVRFKANKLTNQTNHLDKTRNIHKQHRNVHKEYNSYRHLHQYNQIKATDDR